MLIVVVVVVMAELFLSVKNLKQESSVSDNTGRVLELSAQKCEEREGHCEEEFQGRKAAMSIIAWPDILT